MTKEKLKEAQFITKNNPLSIFSRICIRTKIYKKVKASSSVFAPSPTGPLHISVRTALFNYFDKKWRYFLDKN
jgi:hypothetical protein